MLLRRTLAAAVAATLLSAPPAFAQEGTLVIPPEAPVCSGVGETITSCSTDGDDGSGSGAGTVGEGTVITDPAEEIDDPIVGEPDNETAGGPEERGELQALPATAEEPPSAGSARGAAAPAGAAARPRAGATREVPAGSAGARTLPFTGVDAGPLALLGLILLAGGLGLRRASDARV